MAFEQLQQAFLEKSANEVSRCMEAEREPEFTGVKRVTPAFNALAKALKAEIGPAGYRDGSDRAKTSLEQAVATAWQDEKKDYDPVPDWKQRMIDRAVFEAERFMLMHAARGNDLEL